MPLLNMDNFEFPFSVGSVVRGTTLALLITLLLSTGFGIIYHFSSLSENTLPLFTAVILALGVFSGSLAAGKHAGNKGLYHGLAVGLLFFIIVWAVAALFFPGPASLHVFYKLLIALLCGIVGGVIGVGIS